MLRDEKEKLRCDMVKTELDAIRKLQTWGSSLFLGAIALIAAQLFAWDHAPTGSKTHIHISLTTLTAVLPGIVGLAGFVFLRVVNFRARRLQWELGRLAGSPKPWAIGWLGWIIACMPLGFGYLATLVLLYGKAQVGAVALIELIVIVIPQ